MTTAHERTLAALAEVNPPVAAGLKAAGETATGLPLPGYLGWLPDADLADLARAWLIGHNIAIERPAMVGIIAATFRASVWDKPRGDRDETAVADAVIAWSRAHPDRFPLLDVLTVCAQHEVLT